MENRRESDGDINNFVWSRDFRVKLRDSTRLLERCSNHPLRDTLFLLTVINSKTSYHLNDVGVHPVQWRAFPGGMSIQAPSTLNTRKYISLTTFVSLIEKKITPEDITIEGSYSPGMLTSDVKQMRALSSNSSLKVVHLIYFLP